MTKKQFWKLVGYGAIIATISMFTGAIISHLFGYDPEQVHFLLKAYIWILNIIIPYCFVVPIIKIWDKSFNFFNLWLLFISYLISVILILLIGGLDSVYLTTFITLSGIFGVFYGIYKYATKRKKNSKQLLGINND